MSNLDQKIENVANKIEFAAIRHGKTFLSHCI